MTPVAATCTKLTHWPDDPTGARDPTGATLGTRVGTKLGATLGDKLGLRLGATLGEKLGAKLGDMLGDMLGVHDGATVGTNVGPRDGVDDGAAPEIGNDVVGSDDGAADGDRLPAGEEDGSALGDDVDGALDGDVDDCPPTDGDALGDAVGKPLGEAVGVLDGDADGDWEGFDDSCRLGADDGDVVEIVHVPHVDVPLDTRVPVVALYDPVRPDIVTRLPVPTPEELAQLPLDVVARPNQLPDAPLADVSYANVAGGLPDPVQPDDEQNKQPAVHTVHTVGQSADAA